jgi:hypothetical protein
MDKLKRWETEDKETMKKKLKELVAEKQWAEEVEMRCVAAHRRRRGKSLSAHTVRRKQWRRTPMLSRRKSGPIALCSLGGFMFIKSRSMLCTNALFIVH